MDTENSRKRRRYSAELKALILAECAVPGASVAKVAMAHGVNANIVHGWRKLVSGRRTHLDGGCAAQADVVDCQRCGKSSAMRLPTQPANRITELLPHHWQPITSA